MAIELPDEKDQIDFPAILDDYKGELATTAALGAAGMWATGDNRSRIAQYPYNFLKGFYSGGRGAQIGAFGKEVAANALPIMRDIVDPRTSYAYKRTGMSTRGYNELLKLQNDINILRENIDVEKIDNPAKYKDSRKQLAHKQKKQHYKLVNDYSNRFLFRNNPPATDDVARYAKQFVQPVGLKTAVRNSGNSVEAMKYIMDTQGVKDITKAKYLMHKMSPKSGDVMRGIQFDRSVYNTFLRMNEIGLDKLNANNVKVAIAKSNDLKLSDTMKSFGKKGEEKIYFKISPQMKPNYDWGGYQGIVEWDEKNPTKVKFYANDKRDLFGAKLGGKNVINIAPFKEISIPEVMGNIQEDLPEKRKKEIVRDIERNPNSKKIKKFIAADHSPGVNKKDSETIARLIKKHGRYLNYNPLNKKMMNPLWLIRHASIGATGLSLAAIMGLSLYGLSKSMYDKHKKNRAQKT